MTIYDGSILYFTVNLWYVKVMPIYVIFPSEKFFVVTTVCSVMHFQMSVEHSIYVSPQKLPTTSECG